MKLKNAVFLYCLFSSVDGVWEEWTETSTCSVTCGGGTKTHIRNCVKPQHGGKACEGDASKTDTCGEEECPSKLILQYLLIPIRTSKIIKLNNNILNFHLLYFHQLK